MPELAELTALGADLPRRNSVSGVVLAELHDLALVSLAARRGREQACREALAAWNGADLPEPGAVSGRAIWMAPDQWLLRAPSSPTLAHEVKRAAGEAGSLTDQTDAWVGFALVGPGAVAVLQRLCPLDVETMAAGAAARSLIEHLGSLVVCEAAGDFTLLSARSSAASLHHALLTAMHAAL